MKYFCVNCKTRHEISDIGIDLREVCLDKLIEGVNDLFDDLYSQTKNEKIGYIRPFLLDYLKDKKRSGHILRFKGSEIEGLLENPTSERLCLSGVFTLKLGWLEEKFREKLAQDSEGEKALTACKDVLEKGRNSPIFQQELRFFFNDVNGQRVFGHVEDASGDPFTTKEMVADKGTLDEKGNPQMSEIQRQRGYLRCCPRCGANLSPAVGQAEEIVVGLFGSPRAGKTSCLAAVASALRRENNYKGFSMKSFANDLDWQELDPEVRKYNKGCKVTKTPNQQIEAPAYSFLVEVGNSRRVLTMVDMPGEFWDENDNGLSSEFYQQYIDLFDVIDCVWFFVSKLSALEYSVGKEGKRTEKQAKLVRDFSEIDDSDVSVPDKLDMNLTAITQRMASEGKKMPPFACIITKPEADAEDESDMAVYELFPKKGENVNARNKTEFSDVVTVVRARNSGSFQCSLKEQAFYSRSWKVKEYLRERQKDKLVDTIEKNCERRFYISMAAYGHPAGDTENDSTPPTPFHEMYPLLWTLSITGVLPIEHQYIGYHYHWLTGEVVEKQEETEIVTFDARKIRSFKGESEQVRNSASNLFMRKNSYTPTKYKY